MTEAHQDEAPLDLARVWAEFTDPAEPAQRIRADLTWLTSRWHCLFGSGCPGIYADRPDDGCCTLGAHFTDADDVARVAAVAAELTAEDWQLRDTAAEYAGEHPGWVVREEPADDSEEPAVTTRLVDGACIFLNRPGHPGGAGCALHQHALRTGTEPHRAKPDVCWQLPVRRTYRTVELPDETSYLEITLTEFDRRGWGAGGHDLDWYCSGRAVAHTSAEPVFESLAAELTELIGAQAYAELAAYCAAHLATVETAVSRGDRRLLPLLVHPATREAGTGC